MEEFVEKYINPFTDFGFKKIFGQEYNKDLLIDFLNSILERGDDPITDITYGSQEKLPPTKEDRRSVVDIYCESQNKDRFIVEMQKNIQTYFKDRALFYASYPIINQAQRGSEWDYRLSAVYIVAIMDFEFPENEASNSVLHHVKLVELENNKVFYDKLAFVYAEMPKFVKKLDELKTNTDKWLYVLKNISKLQNLPEELENNIFKKFFDEAKIANYSKEDYYAYQESLKIYRDNKAVLKTAIEEGRKEERKIQEEKIKKIEEKHIEELQKKDSMIQQKDDMLQEKDSMLQEKDSMLQEKDNKLQQLAQLLLDQGFTKEQIQEKTNIKLD